MSLTMSIKQELAAGQLLRQNEKMAQTACLLRFAGGLHIVSKRIVVEAEVDNEAVMELLVRSLTDLYQAKSNVVLVGAAGIRRADRYVVRVVEDAERLARLSGLLDRLGRPTRGLPSAIVAAAPTEAAAAWRGAFMARGSLSHPHRSGSLEVNCPGPEAALALVGAARRLGVVAKSREVRGSDRVVVRDSDMIIRLLRALGAKQAAEIWQVGRDERELRGSVNRLANFDDANLRRSARAAVAAAARVRRAFEILGENIPDHLRQAGQLRLEYSEASLEELGQKADPPLTKDAVAGRIRRLLALADKTAKEQGVPTTHSAISPEMLGD